ncbi:hypothetical protein Mx8p25 [Myxococcus phage Mx8]|uniref:p25 n=1 Tax=Myxococcus phage Mx8 TaxID=49964 RepID=Q94MU4_9CAUD|nr:hypothetical protein Mx8p25 [Myxococcus phage Mx8]AAK94360.1 p25 [Myxococcus phage Mx8]
MSFPRSLDEYGDKELQQELARRAEVRERGLCDYCGRSSRAPSCKFSERHHSRDGHTVAGNGVRR